MTGRSSNRKSARSSALRSQRGVIMWVALGVLIVMSLVGLAMLRQMGGGVSIAGNVAFKQGATAAADLGTEAGRNWFINAASTDSDVTASGYYASWGTSVDPTTFDWADAPSLTDSANNTVQYIVHRLCKVAGAPTAVNQECSSEVMLSPSRGGGSAPPFTTIKPYYRITTKVTGARNTVSYTQVVTN
jgi:Tfp pilus assembly protein PilX